MEDALIMRRVNVHINGPIREYLDSGVMATGLRVYRIQQWKDQREGERELVYESWSTHPAGATHYRTCEELMKAMESLETLALLAADGTTEGTEGTETEVPVP
jgi:hypothetical protein